LKNSFHLKQLILELLNNLQQKQNTLSKSVKSMSYLLSCFSPLDNFFGYNMIQKSVLSIYLLKNSFHLKQLILKLLNNLQQKQNTLSKSVKSMSYLLSCFSPLDNFFGYNMIQKSVLSIYLLKNQYQLS